MTWLSWKLYKRLHFQLSNEYWPEGATHESASCEIHPRCPSPRIEILVVNMDLMELLIYPLKYIKYLDTVEYNFTIHNYHFYFY